MALEFTDSASKHGIPHEDAIYAILHAVGTETVQEHLGQEARVFVGHPRSQTDRYIEVIAAKRGNVFRIFHVMPLSDLYRHLVRRKS